jgi:Cupredoxin-like domain
MAVGVPQFGSDLARMRPLRDALASQLLFKSRRSSVKFLLASALVSTLAILTSPPVSAGSTRVIEMKVTTAGYVPAEIEVGDGEEVDLKVTRETDITCATEIVIPDLKINEPLPLGKTVVVHLPKMKKGVHRFGCAMDLMISGKIKTGTSMK